MSPGVDPSITPPPDSRPPTDPHAGWARAARSMQDSKASAEKAAEARSRKAANNKRWRAEHVEEKRAYNRRYRIEHPEIVRAATVRAEARKKKRAAQRIRQRERERARYARDPAKRREQIDRWRAAHPEKAAQYAKRYYVAHRDDRLTQARRWRDENPEKRAAGMRDWQQRNREHLTDYQRRYRAEHPEVYEKALAATRDRQRVSRRVKALGLPPIRKVRVAARDRRAHEAEAGQFFDRRRLVWERQRLQDEFRPFDRGVLSGWQQRSPLARRRAAQLAEFWAGLRRAAGELPAITEDMRMDAIARRVRGQLPVDPAADVRQRVFDSAGGARFLDAGGDRIAAGVLVEQHLDDRTAAVLDPAGGRLVWIPDHERQGHPVAGHWRRFARAPGAGHGEGTQSASA